MKFFGFAIVFLLLTGVISQEVTLAPERIDVMENANVTLTCTTHSHISIWRKSDYPSKWPFILLKDGVCVVNGHLNNSLLYSWNCHGNGSFSLTLLKVKETQQNDTWTCRGINFSPLSNDVTVNIQVRVKAVEITTPVENKMTVIENEHALFRCKTSYSRPTPQIKWFMRLKEETNQINANSSIEIISNENGLKSAISALSISVNREKQEAEIYCSGTNGIEGEIASRNIKIEVYYAPDRGPVIEKASNNSIYKVKENSTCNITCTIVWANPLPVLSWNCDGTQKYSYEDKREVRLNIQWQAKRDEDKVCTCTATQEIAGIQTTSMKIEVLYPPVIETITFEHKEIPKNIKVNESIKVIEKETFILKCEARSKPEPSYKWTGRTESNDSSITIVNPQVRQFYTETCHARNIMKFNNGEEEAVSTKTNVKVEVLYPPKIKLLPDRRVTEGSDVEITCPITYGNPPATSYIWTREDDDIHWLTDTLTIFNISRKDSMGYTCLANNSMVMTGNMRKIGSSSKNMTIEVLYPPDRPTLFLVSIAEMNVNMPITDTLIVAEHTPFTLFCNANSLPMPNLYSWDLISTLNSSVIHIPGLMRNDKQSFTCHVSNVMIPTEGTSKTGENNVTIPIDIQFSPDIGNMTNIVPEEATDVNFTCPLINGNPIQTSVMWIRGNDGRKWLEPYFSLKNVSRTDSSIYTCRVNNTMVMTGDLVKEGIRNKSITMNVLYKVLILNYQAVNYSTNDMVTVAENETVTLKCVMEGNPAPEGKIFSREQLEITKFVNEKYTIVSVTFKATCSHKGVYTCQGTNIIKQERVSDRNISLYVTCSPRQDPTTPFQKRIQTPRNTAMTLNFTVLAYPKPTRVLVKKYNQRSWIPVIIGDNLEITHSGLDIRFTIHRVTNKDYGKYQLSISNDYGKYEHIFYVEPVATISPESEPRTNYGLVVGVPLVVLVIISAFGVGFILHKNSYCKVLGDILHIQQSHGEMNPTNVYQNIISQDREDNGEENVYEKIKMAELEADRATYEQYKIERADQSEMSYEKLSDELKDTKQYSGLDTLHNTKDDIEEDQDISDLNVNKNAIYINMKI